MTSIEIEPIATEDYVRDVLPESFALWGGKRSFERYADDFRTMANSAYGRRRPFTMGLRDDGVLAASCKTYDRELRWERSSLRAVGIGAVFTPPRIRGRGYATAMLGALLDAERAAGTDVAFLFSDIHPVFYARLGFVALPSRVLSLRATSLDDAQVRPAPLEARDWPGVRRCFETLDLARPWSLRRTPLVWDWMRRRWSASPDGAQMVQLVVRRGRGVIAYAFGLRLPREDAFALDDFAFAGDEGRAILPALLRSAAGDLRRICGWVPPPVAREALPRGSSRARKTAIFMVAPLSPGARAWWAANKPRSLASSADACWDADHV